MVEKGKDKGVVPLDVFGVGNEVQDEVEDGYVFVDRAVSSSPVAGPSSSWAFIARPLSPDEQHKPTPVDPLDLTGEQVVPTDGKGKGKAKNKK